MIGRKFQRGFTILELSISLFILGLIATTAMNFVASKSESQRIITTHDRMIYIVEILQKYVETFGRLPCPANGALGITDANLGIGTGTDVDDTAIETRCSAANFGFTAGVGPTAIAGNIVAGSVPTGTLGIEPYYMMDGWNRRFTYVVDSDLTYNATTDFSALADAGDIAVLDSAGGTLILERNADGTESLTPGGAAVLIVSHGKNGHGAWRYKGIASRINVGKRSENGVLGDDDALEGENAHVNTPGNYNGVFISSGTRTAGLNAGDAGGPKDDNYFDDIVIYRTKWRLENP